MKRKNSIYISLVVMLMAGITIYFEACKKEIVTPIINSNSLGENHPIYTEEAKLVAGRVREFKRQLADKEAVMRKDVDMPIDSMIWNVEALFNAEFANPERRYLKTVTQELELSIDVSGDDKVAFGDVAEFYDDITDAVRQAYVDDGFTTGKSLKAVVVEKGETVGDTRKINVYVVSGEADDDNSVRDPVTGPFGPGDCWYYGEYGGTCDDPTVFGDGAEIIEDSINYYYGGTIVPQPGFRSLNFGMYRVPLKGNEYIDENGEPYLFFHNINENPSLYMDDQMLNYYYLRELEVLLHLLPEDSLKVGVLPIIPAFIEVDIIGQFGFVDDGNYYHHMNHVIYGSKMAIPSQELPPVRDLLN